MAALTIIEFPDEPTAEFDIEAQAEFVSASAGGDTFQNDGRTGLYVNNSSGSPRTVTISGARNCNHGFEHDAAIVVADGFAGFVRHDFPTNRFSDANGVVSITYSSEAGLEVAAVRTS